MLLTQLPCMAALLLLFCLVPGCHSCPCCAANHHCLHTVQLQYCDLTWYHYCRVQPVVTTEESRPVLAFYGGARYVRAGMCVSWGVP